MTTQTLTGNFYSKGAKEQMSSLLTVSVLTSLVMALAFAAVSVLFPDAVFGLLTNHTEVNRHISDYSIWLLPLLGLTAIAFMLEGYFIGLKEGATLRNAVLMAFGLGFLPLAITAWYVHNNQLLWMSLVAYMAINMTALAVQIPRTLGSQSLQNQQPLPSS
jgi:MATE family multidrug resistance protein